MNNLKHSDMKDDQGDQDLCDGSAYRQTSNDQAEDSVKVLYLAN